MPEGPALPVKFLVPLVDCSTFFIFVVHKEGFEVKQVELGLRQTLNVVQYFFWLLFSFRSSFLFFLCFLLTSLDSFFFGIRNCDWFYWFCAERDGSLNCGELRHLVEFACPLWNF